jgi:hypothetical protein
MRRRDGSSQRRADYGVHGISPAGKNLHADSLRSRFANDDTP